MSTLFLRTLRDDPADAEVASHRLLIRAGYVRRVAPGIFTWLPLGLMVLRNIERVVREEMDSRGFQEVRFPSLLPREPYETTGRWTEYGPNIFRLKDRRDGDYLLGPTHEEMFTLLVKGEYSSYKDLPLTLYQIQTKYRDEARPRAGILRGREFVMKDSYSFDVDDAGLQESYASHREAYLAVFDRLGLDYVVVAATSGAMGGSASEEFLAVTDIGEDTFVRCPSCGYAANVEAVVTPVPASVPIEGQPAAHVEDTPDAASIAALVAASNGRDDLRRPDRGWTAADTLKHLAFTVHHPDGASSVLVIALPGDREVDPKRLEAVLAPAEAVPFDEAAFAAHPGLVRGYLGPGAAAADPAVRYVVDPRVAPGTRWISGADEPGRHVYDLVAGRDFAVGETIEAAQVREGDSCPTCGSGLELARGIEIGHIFQLGRKYAAALDLTVLDVNGSRVVVTMGSYGIGVSRAVAVVAEQHYDDKGLVWPREIAPADVHLVLAGRNEATTVAAELLASDLEAQGVRVLLDDRKGISPGVKFNDAELLGLPTTVVVGKRLVDGVVEVRDRATGERREVPLDEVVGVLSGC